MISPRSLSISANGFATLDNSNLFTPKSTPNLQTQNNTTQNHRHSQTNINQPNNRPITHSPIRAELQSITIKLMMNNPINPPQQQNNKNRTNQPQNKDNPNKPIVKQQTLPSQTPHQIKKTTTNNKNIMTPKSKLQNSIQNQPLNARPKPKREHQTQTTIPRNRKKNNIKDSESKPNKTTASVVAPVVSF